MKVVEVQQTMLVGFRVKIMNKIYFQFLCVATMIIWSSLSFADDKTELNVLLNEFLAFDSSNALEKHRRFWADDLIYTSSAGKRFGKAEIINGLKKEQEETKMRDNQLQENASDAGVEKYHAEDVDIRIFGNTAIITLKLVQTSVSNKFETKKYYLNTGTFLKRQGKWQAVAWQATKIPNVVER